MSDFTYFIIISDSENTVKNIEGIVYKIAKSPVILKYDNGEEGLKAIEKQKRPAVVILTKELSTMNGFQILSILSKNVNLPKHHYILLTDKDDQKLNVDAIKLGANDILSKPYSVDKLIFKIRNAFQVISSSNSEINLKDSTGKLQEQINNLSNQVIQTLSQIVNSIYPKSEHINQVKASSLWIAKRLCNDEADIKNIEKASQISYLGKILLSEKLMTKPVLIEGMIQNENMEKVPQNVKLLLNEIEPLSEITSIVYHIYENFDGSGIPEKVKAWKIPIGSRILRVCMDYLELFDKNAKKSSKTMDALLHESKRLYDHRVIAYYDQFLAANPKFSDSRFDELTMPLKELQDGMILARNIITDSGLNLMPAGQELTESKIDKIKSISESDPIIGNIYIQK